MQWCALTLLFWLCGGLQIVVWRPAGRTRPPTRNGFRFLWLHGRWAGSDRCGGALSIPAHRAIVIVGCLTCLVCLAQVYGVGGGDLRQMPDFRGASGAEMQGWPAVDGLLSASVGSAEPARTLGRGLGGWSGGGSPLTGRKVSLDRGVVPGRRARQLWLLPASLLCGPVCAHQQAPGS